MDSVQWGVIKGMASALPGLRLHQQTLPLEKISLTNEPWKMCKYLLHKHGMGEAGKERQPSSKQREIYHSHWWCSGYFLPVFVSVSPSFCKSHGPPLAQVMYLWVNLCANTCPCQRSWELLKHPSLGGSRVQLCREGTLPEPEEVLEADRVRGGAWRAPLQWAPGDLEESIPSLWLLSSWKFSSEEWVSGLGELPETGTGSFSSVSTWAGPEPAVVNACWVNTWVTAFSLGFLACLPTCLDKCCFWCWNFLPVLVLSICVVKITLSLKSVLSVRDVNFQSIKTIRFTN